MAALTFTPLVTVTGSWVDPGNEPAEGSVTFTLTSPIYDPAGNVIAARVPHTVDLDENGAISVPLVPTDNPEANPSGVLYKVVERILSGPHGRRVARKRIYYIPVPFDAPGWTIDLADLSPINEGSPIFIPPVLPEILVRRFGAKLDGVTDDTDAWVEAVAYAKSIGGGVVLHDRPTVSIIRPEEIVVSESNVIIAGLNWYSRIKAKGGIAGRLIRFTATGAAHKEGNRIHSGGMRTISIDGGGRVDDVVGIELDMVQRMIFSTVQVRHCKHQGVNWARSVRNCRFWDVFVKHCGDIDDDKPAWDVRDDPSTTDGHNLNHSFGCEITNSHGIMLDAGLPADEANLDIVRNNRWVSCDFHGWSEGATENIDGYTYTADHKWRAGCLRFWNARSHRLIDCRIHSSGPGTQLVQVVDNVNTSAVNDLDLALVDFGATGVGGSSAKTVTVDAGTDVFTAVGHGFVTGMRVHVEATTTIPGPLVVRTSYYVIRLGADTFKLASSQANAYAGTALGINDAGVGVVTVTRVSWEANFVAASDDVLTVAGHRLSTGSRVRVSTTGVLPAGLVAGTDYFAIRLDDDTFKLAVSYSAAYSATAIDIGDAGTGTHLIAAQDAHVGIQAASRVAVTSPVWAGANVRANIINADVNDDVLYVSADADAIVESAGATHYRYAGGTLQSKSFDIVAADGTVLASISSSGRLRTANGALATPAHSFVNFPDVGAYCLSSGDYRISVGGVMGKRVANVGGVIHEGFYGGFGGAKQAIAGSRAALGAQGLADALRVALSTAGVITDNTTP